MGIHLSRLQQNPNIQRDDVDEDYDLPHDRERHMKRGVPLHKAALKGEWNAAENLLQEDSTLMTAELTEGRETLLHVAALEGNATFVDHLLERMDDSHLQLLNGKDCTALTLAATAGHLSIVKTMVNRCPHLTNIKGPHGVTPLYMAALIGHADVARYLFDSPHQSFPSWPLQDQLQLLTTSIDTGLYGLARSIVKKNRRLAAPVDANSNDIHPLAILARNPSAFAQNSQQAGGRLQSFGSKVMKVIRRESAYCSASDDAYALFDCLWNSMMSERDIEQGRLYDEDTSNLVFNVVESGNYHFLVELIRKDPSFLYKFNENSQSIFHIAALHRHVEIFNLIYEVGSGKKDLIATCRDPDDNNILHLAAKLSPPHKLESLPGAALQMQREVLWYKVVEKIVQPSYRNMGNRQGVTPHQLFLEEHRELMKQGEREMKQIAKSCMVVTTLITTVVFSSAFTVPGGYDDNTGVPILLQRRHRMFVPFPICEALATLSSLVSMLMFLSVLTSRYAEDDFLTTVPFWVVTGVLTLFVSIVSMMASFCISLLLYGDGDITVKVLLGLLGCVPLMFIALNSRLLVGVVRSNYGSRCLFASNANSNNNHLF